MTGIINTQKVELLQLTLTISVSELCRLGYRHSYISEDTTARLPRPILRYPSKVTTSHRLVLHLHLTLRRIAVVSP